MSLAGFATIFVFAAVGALIQGAIGYGLNLVVVPVAAAVAPASLPAAMIIMALPMTAGSAALEFRHIDRSAVLWLTLGRVPGVLIGALIVAAVTPETLSIVIGAIVLGVALLSVASPSVAVTPATSLAAGLAAGITGTASSIGGPPVAILLQNAPGPTLRATAGATFLLGVAMSLGALMLVGAVERWHWTLGLALTPAIALGLFASRSLHPWLDAGWLRPCVLGFAALSGLAVIVRGLV